MNNIININWHDKSLRFKVFYDFTRGMAGTWDFPPEADEFAINHIFAGSNFKINCDDNLKPEIFDLIIKELEKNN